MPIHTKKAAVRNREVSINNQIASIFVNNNGTVSINPNAVPIYDVKTATTSLAISGTYQIPLVSSTSGNQVFNKSTNLVYDTNTNTLTVPNLTTTYLPQCSQVPTQPNQLVNKAYLDQYVGSYNQQWIYDDWLTGDISGSLGWGVSTNTISSSVISESGHHGIVRLQRNAGQNGYMKLNDKIGFTSNTIKCVRFLVRPFATNSGNINSVDLRLHLGGYSPDTYDIGQNWLNPTATIDYAPSSICWSSELGLFCAACDSNRIATSSDGSTWNVLSTNGSFGSSNDICWSPELRIFVVVAHNNNRCATSPDGFTWTTRTSLNALSGLDGHNVQWSSVCWSRELGLFCAVGWDGSIQISEAINNYCVALSRDGITWNLSTSGVKNYYWSYVCWSAELGLFCAVANGSASSNRIMVSRDGYNWSNATNGNGSYDYVQVCWSAELGLFCAVGNGNIIVSRDGYNWTPSISGVRNIIWEGICWSRELGLFCATTSNGSGNNRVIISRDGLNWIEATSGVVAGKWGSVCWSPELSTFCALSYDTNTQRVLITNPAYRMPTTKSAYWSLTAGSSTGTFTLTDNIKWDCFVSRYGNGNPQGSYNAGSLSNKWVLFEIEINDRKPSFYITVIGETNRILVYKELINTIDSTALIQPSIIFRSSNKGISGAVPIFDVDYVDILYNKY
jgi:hypothetical protein